MKPFIAISKHRGYDDWEEVYTSDRGYWLEDDVESGEIISITIFIKELEDDDVFFRYDWCNNPG